MFVLIFLIVFEKTVFSIPLKVVFGTDQLYLDYK